MVKLVTSRSVRVADQFTPWEAWNVSPKEVLPMCVFRWEMFLTLITDAISSSEPANGISSPPTETANHDLPEESTTPPNGIIAGSSASIRASKRKRDSLPLHLEKVAPTSADEAEKGKNKKVSKLTGKGKVQEVIDQGTSKATINVKPRRKIQSRALPKNLSKAWTASRSRSGASATYIECYSHHLLLPWLPPFPAINQSQSLP